MVQICRLSFPTSTHQSSKKKQKTNHSLPNGQTKCTLKTKHANWNTQWQFYEWISLQNLSSCFTNSFVITKTANQWKSELQVFDNINRWHLYPPDLQTLTRWDAWRGFLEDKRPAKILCQMPQPTIPNEQEMNYIALPKIIYFFFHTVTFICNTSVSLRFDSWRIFEKSRL